MSKLRNDKISVELDVNAQKAEKEIYRLNKEIGNIRKQNTEHRKEISRLAATEGDYSAEIKRLNEAIRANNKEIDSRKKQIESERQSIDLSRLSAADLGKELKRLKKDLSNTSKATNLEKYKELETKIKRVEKAYAQATKSTRGFLTSLISLDKIATTVKGFFMGLGMVITNYVVGAFKNLIGTIQDFERANSKLAAVLGTNIDGIAKLTEQAKYLGRTTTATASEVTGLQTELAKLGFSQDIIEKLTPATLKFAKAVDTDLASAAAFAGAAMRIFNKDAGEAESVMATFAVATTKSALDFRKLESSLATVGPVANAFGFSVEETTALLGQLANAGFDASSAATATRNILLNLADSNGDLAKALGGPVTNLDQLVAGLQKLEGEGVDLAKALELTDKRSVAAFTTFLKGADDILALRDSITGCTGDFNKMSETMADNASAAAKGFESAVEGLILKFFDIREVLKSLFEAGTAVVQWFGELIDSLDPVVTLLKLCLSPLGRLLSGIVSLVSWVAKLTTQTRLGRAVLNGIIAGLIAYKTATLMASIATRTFYKNIVATSKAALLFVKNFALKAKAMITEAALNIKAAIATRSFNAALMSNPIILIISLLAMAIAAIIGYNSAINDATEATDAWSEASREASKQYGEQKGKIEALIMVANNENLSLKRRKKAIDELNRIIPDYNAKIDETTGKYTASKEALDKYLKSLEKEMRYKANESKLKELTAAAEEARDAYEEAMIKMAESPKYIQKWYGAVYNQAPRAAAGRAKVLWDVAEANLRDFTSRMQDAILKGTIVPPSNDEESLNDFLGDADSKSSKVVSRLKEINAELKRLRKIDPQSDEELDRIKKRIELLKQEKKELLGNPKNKHEIGTYQEDSIDEVTAPVDDSHQRRLLTINKADMSETERTIAKNKELIRYCNELSAALNKMKSNTDSTHSQTLDKINAEQNKIAQDIVTAQKNIDTAMVEQDNEFHSQRVAAIDAFYSKQSDLIRAEVIADRNMKEAAAVYQMKLDRDHHQDQLKELQRYQDKVIAADYYSSDEKKKILAKTGAEISKLQSKILTDTGKFSEALDEAMADNTSAEGIKNRFTQQRVALNAYYTALLESVEKGSDEAVALEKERQRRVAALNYEQQEQMFQIQEIAGLSWADEYDRELAQLRNFHDQGIIDEKTYQKKKLQLGITNAKKYFDYYSGLASSMFSAMQDAEIAASEAKYDVLIQQAKNNGEDTASLEQEKENKKLEIQKKYADVNFAIKVSQIIADTAVSIMQAFAQLGPIGGAVAAAMLTATGMVQVATAKAERDKIKNMQPGNVSGEAKQSAKAERILSGYSEGGYTGNGGRYEVAGVVHRGEYVVPMPIMKDPRVIDAVGTIEAIRRNKILSSGVPVATPSAGYADGGFTSSPMAVDTTGLLEAVRELRAVASNMRAYVVLRDIDNARDTMDRANAPFTRKR